MCERELESKLHVLVYCTHAAAVWETIGLAQEIRSFMSIVADFRDCFFQLMQCLNETNRNTFVMILWSLL